MTESRPFDPAAETDRVIAAVLASMTGPRPARHHRRLAARRREKHPGRPGRRRTGGWRRDLHHRRADQQPGR